MGRVRPTDAPNDLATRAIEARVGKEVTMGEKNKQGREKRKPKKEKTVSAKTGREADVLQHVSQHTPPSEERS